MIIISDPHGCYNTFRRLLRKCPDEQLVLGGDLIDRGPNSKAMVEFAIENNIPTVRGNHEDLCLWHHSNRKDLDPYDENLWLYNGGRMALASYPGGKMTPAHLEWMRKLPLHLSFGELLVSHTGHGLHPDEQTALWARDFYFPKDGRFRVFGHTPHKEPYFGTNYVCIDTGCAYHDRGYGKLTAFLWPQREIIQQDYDESPL
jgi:serine/threonine protein phosphatase 1